MSLIVLQLRVQCGIVRLQWLASDDGIGGSLPVSILKMLCLLLMLDVCIVVCQSSQCGGAGLGNP